MGNQGISRRAVLELASWFIGLGAFALSLGVVAWSARPRRVRDLSRRFSVGPPSAFAMGSETYLADRELFLFREVEGFYAISSRCTHLGCIVSKHQDGFDCPCHGARFDRRGRPLKSPATRPLPWYEVSLAPDGQLVVDTTRRVESGTRFRL